MLACKFLLSITTYKTGTNFNWKALLQWEEIDKKSAITYCDYIILLMVENIQNSQLSAVWGMWTLMIFCNCSSALWAARLSVDWTADPRLNPVGMLRVWPASTSRLPHAAPRPGSCNYGEAFFPTTHTHKWMSYDIKNRSRRQKHTCIRTNTHKYKCHDKNQILQQNALTNTNVQRMQGHIQAFRFARIQTHANT